jgi:hypothetical protein
MLITEWPEEGSSPSYIRENSTDFYIRNIFPWKGGIRVSREKKKKWYTKHLAKEQSGSFTDLKI